MSTPADTPAVTDAGEGSPQEGHTKHGSGPHGGPAKHKKGHGGHGGGGHGGSWIVTYSDMVTLLMAFFICIITFSSKETERFSPKKDSLVGGAGGKGITSSLEKHTLDWNSVVWRLRTYQARVSDSGTEMAPIYQDPSIEMTGRILHALEETVPGRLTDNFAVRLPLSLLFEKGDRLSSSGVRVLHAVAVNLRDLPYDLQFQVAHAEHTPLAVKMCVYLMSEEGCQPARLAVGSRPPVGGDRDSAWLVLARHF
jgi:hypothetical protein